MTGSAATSREAIWKIVLFVAALGPSSALGQDIALDTGEHPWGAFPVGSWKTVRVTSETFDDKGNVTNVTITDTTSLLTALDRDGYTLQVQTVVEIAGKRLNSQPQIVKHGFFGQKPGEPVSYKKVGDAQVTIDGRVIPCELREAVFDSEGTRRISKIHYSPDVSPFQLRRETTVASDAMDESAKDTTVVEVIALDLPQRVVTELQPASYIKTTRKNNQGARITLEVHCDHVPGGVVSHAATETDAQGRMIKRSTLELVAYGVGKESPTTEIQPRRRMHRNRPRKTATR